MSFRTRGWEECQHVAKLREHLKHVIFNISDQHDGHDKSTDNHGVQKRNQATIAREK